MSRKMVVVAAVPLEVAVNKGRESCGISKLTISGKIYFSGYLGQVEVLIRGVRHMV